MELWFTERHTPYVNFSIKVERQLYTAQSEFQRIDVFESREFGRFLTLDGYMMLTEKDEFIYHEMITHIPMAVHPNPENILVIGAGDGGVVRRADALSVAEVHRPRRDRRAGHRGLPQVSAEDGLPSRRPARAYPYCGRAEVHPLLREQIRPHHRGLHGPVRPRRGPVHKGILRQLL